jgi:hypothetical protein
MNRFKIFVQTFLWEITALAMFAPKELPLFLWYRYMSLGAVKFNVKKNAERRY